MADSDVTALLERLTSPDKAVRGEAEKHYESLKFEAKVALPLILLQVFNSEVAAVHIRQLAIVLTRRLLVEDAENLYRSMDKEIQLSLRQGLLDALSKENDVAMKARICDLVGEFGGLILEEDEWPEVLAYSYHCVQSSSYLDKETGLALFGMLSGAVIDSLSRMPENTSAVAGLFHASLIDSSHDCRVMLSAVKAFVSLILGLPTESAQDTFQPVVPSLLAGLQSLVQTGLADEKLLAVSIAFSESLIELAENSNFFYPQLGLVFSSLMTIAENHSVPASTRHMILEVLVNLCTTSPKKARKLKGPNGESGIFAGRFIPLCVQMMTTVSDDSKWATRDTAEDFASSNATDCDVGETALDRVCHALGLRATLGVMMGQLHRLFQTPTWQSAYTGLIAMGNYLEVTVAINDKTQALNHREEVINTLAVFSSNAIPRIRGAAFYAMIQLIVMHGKQLTEPQLERIVAIIFANTSSNVNPSPRVRANVMMALMNLIDVVPSSWVKGHTETVLEAVVDSLRTGPAMVQELCVSTIISLTETLEGEVLARYYDQLMPILKQLLVHAHGHGLESLWGQGLECCARLGEASGRNKFYPDALEMMNILVHAQSQIDESADMRKYLMKAWVRIARCLGAEFLPFLQLVMDKLFAAITQDLTAGTGDIDLDDVEARSDVEMVETEDGCWQVVRTAAVEEQGSACQLLVLLVDRLQEHFYPHVEQSTRAMAPLVKSPHEDVRSYALASLGEFVRCTAKATAPDRGPLANLSEYCLGLVLEAIEKEDVLELIITGLQTLKHILYYLCTNWSRELADGLGMKEPPVPTPLTSIRMLNEAQMEAITQCTKQVLKDSIQRRAVLRAEAQVSGGRDEEDVDDEKAFMAESLELHFNISEVIGAIFRTHGEAYFPVFLRSMHDSVMEMSNSYCLSEDRRFSFYVISDVIEFGLSVNVASTYFAQVIPVLSEACVSVPEAGLRQACAYALGIAAERYPQEFQSYALSALHSLGGCLAMGEDPEEARGQCTDNAVAAVGFILEKMEILGIVGIPFSSLWGQWLDYLPLQFDEEESKKVLSQLLRLLNSRHESLLMGTARLPQAIRVMLQAFETPCSSKVIDQNIKQSLILLGANYCKDSTPEQFIKQIVHANFSDLTAKMERILAMQCNTFLGSSPLATAPIHDVLLRR